MVKLSNLYADKPHHDFVYASAEGSRLYRIAVVLRYQRVASHVLQASSCRYAA
jgi:hypothetical protein